MNAYICTRSFIKKLPNIHMMNHYLETILKTVLSILTFLFLSVNVNLRQVYNGRVAPKFVPSYGKLDVTKLPEYLEMVSKNQD